MPGEFITRATDGSFRQGGPVSQQSGRLVSAKPWTWPTASYVASQGRFRWKRCCVHVRAGGLNVERWKQSRKQSERTTKNGGRCCFFLYRCNFSYASAFSTLVTDFRFNMSSNHTSVPRIPRCMRSIKAFSEVCQEVSTFANHVEAIPAQC